MAPQDTDNKPIPMTPIRGRFCKLDIFHPVEALRKHNRDELVLSEGLTSSPARAPSSDELSIVNSRAPPSACVAFQLHDNSLDAVVITTLPCYPFCCHEDLLLMSRQQLVEVALLFNSRLPQNTQIELSDTIGDAHIRHCIEKLVGIIPNIPGAPRPSKSRVLDRDDESMLKLTMELHADPFPSPPTSPLATRVPRRRGLSLMSSPPRVLESLQEEDEDSVIANQRHVKKRKVSDIQATPTRILYEQDDRDVEVTSAPTRTFKVRGRTATAPVSYGTPSVSAGRGYSKRLRDSEDLDSDLKSPTQRHGRSHSRFGSYEDGSTHVGIVNKASASRSSKFASLEERISRDMDGMRMGVA